MLDIGSSGCQSGVWVVVPLSGLAKYSGSAWIHLGGNVFVLKRKLCSVCTVQQ